MFQRTAASAVWPRASQARCTVVRKEFRFLIKASRPGFYLTAMWFYLLPLGPHLPWHSPVFWLGLFYVGFPLGMLIYAANDIGDEFTDRLNPRKDTFLFGARPSGAQIAALPSRIALVQLPFVAAFTYLLGPRALLWFGGTVAVTMIYNAPRWGVKDRPPFDVLAQAGYLQVFVLACWLNGVALGAWPIWVFGALFAGHSHLFGEVIDIAPDGAAGRRTTAVALGARATKLLIAAFLLVEAAIALQMADKPWLPLGLGVAALGFGFDALWLWREKSYPTWLITLFFLGWNVVLVGEVALSWLWHFKR